MAADEQARWLVLVVRVPAEPSRHRVAVWRELRRAGALPLGQGSWALPEVPAVAERVARVADLAGRGAGEVITLRAAGRGEEDSARLSAWFTAARPAEWAEFIADCSKFDAEIDSEIAQGKLTLPNWKRKSRAWTGSAAGTGDWRCVTCSARRTPPRPASSSSTAPSGSPTTPGRCSGPSARCDAATATPDPACHLHYCRRTACLRIK